MTPGWTADVGNSWYWNMFGRKSERRYNYDFWVEHETETKIKQDKHDNFDKSAKLHLIVHFHLISYHFVILVYWSPLHYLEQKAKVKEQTNG